MLRPRTAEEVAHALRLAPLRASARERRRDRARGRPQLRRRRPERRRRCASTPPPCAGRSRWTPAVRPVRVGAGTTFARAAAVARAHAGLTLPVVPGTRHLTVGGAIASDVHGKNHPRDGSLARHVRVLHAVHAGRRARCSSPRERDPELFDATLGGMGLTGVVVEATLRVVPLRNPRARGRHRPPRQPRAGDRADRRRAAPPLRDRVGRPARRGRRVRPRGAHALRRRPRVDAAEGVAGHRGDRAASRRAQRWRGSDAPFSLRPVSPSHAASRAGCCAPRRCAPSTRCTGTPRPAARGGGRSA